MRSVCTIEFPHLNPQPDLIFQIAGYLFKNRFTVLLIIGGNLLRPHDCLKDFGGWSLFTVVQSYRRVLLQKIVGSGELSGFMTCPVREHNYNMQVKNVVY